MEHRLVGQVPRGFPGDMQRMDVHVVGSNHCRFSLGLLCLLTISNPRMRPQYNGNVHLVLVFSLDASRPIRPDIKTKLSNKKWLKCHEPKSTPAQRLSSAVVVRLRPTFGFLGGSFRTPVHDPSRTPPVSLLVLAGTSVRSNPKLRG